MADPTIQTFCCHWPNITETPVKIMLEFNTFSYNIVSLIASLFGIFGACYQICPRTKPILAHRWYSYSIFRSRQMIVWLAWADLCASLGVFVRSSLWLYLQHSEEDELTIVLSCSLISAWIQYFYTATWLWTLFYAIDVRLVLGERAGRTVSYQLLAWGLPAILTTVGLLVLYLPDGNCHMLKSLSSAVLHILPNYFATYIPIAIVMIANPILYRSSTQSVKALAALDLNQYTSKERNFITAMTIKFCMINIVFYICWLPNIVNGILLWTLWFNLPEKYILILWYIMAILNPLQAAFNCIIYRRWASTNEQICLPCLRQTSIETLQSEDSEVSGEAAPAETTPLLPTEYSATSRSINGSDLKD